MMEYTVKVCDDRTEWFLNDQLHREDDLPAVIYANGYKAWWLNGKLHRKDGPAIECVNGNNYWYLNDECLTEEGFLDRTAKPKNSKLLKCLKQLLKCLEEEG